MSKLFGILLLAAALAGRAQGALATNVAIAWDANPTQEMILAYRFFERAGTNWNLLASTTNTTHVLSNYNFGAMHTYSVSASNVWGESPKATPLILPTLASPPTNLHPVTSSLKVPVPSVVEISRDLATWNERFIFEPDPAGLSVRIVQYPSEPMLLMRQKPPTVFAAPLRPAR